MLKLNIQGRQLFRPVCFLSEKGSTQKTKNLLPFHWQQFFPFRVDPFQKRLGAQDSKQEVTKDVSLVINGLNCEIYMEQLEPYTEK